MFGGNRFLRVEGQKNFRQKRKILRAGIWILRDFFFNMNYEDHGKSIIMICNLSVVILLCPKPFFRFSMWQIYALTFLEPEFALICAYDEHFFFNMNCYH